jgi:hypothetical protein
MEYRLRYNILKKQQHEVVLYKCKKRIFHSYSGNNGPVDICLVKPKCSEEKCPEFSSI